VELVGGAAHPGVEAALGGLLAEPFAGRVVAPDPAEIHVAEAEHGAVVDHAAMLVAHRGVDDLPTESFFMLRVTQSCISSSASGPVTSYLRSGERSITAAFSRQAQYSAMAPWLCMVWGSQ
jgi:hypothetical protein